MLLVVGSSTNEYVQHYMYIGGWVVAPTSHYILHCMYMLLVVDSSTDANVLLCMCIGGGACWLGLPISSNSTTFVVYG
jgi:hypothetical protein